MAASKSLAKALVDARRKGWTIWLEGYGDGPLRHWNAEAHSVKERELDVDDKRGEFKSMEALINWLNALPKRMPGRKRNGLTQ